MKLSVFSHLLGKSHTWTIPHIGNAFERAAWLSCFVPIRGIMDYPMYNWEYTSEIVGITIDNFTKPGLHSGYLT